MKLIICGNGLDIHVGLNTSYRAYRSYLEKEKIFDGEKAISIIENSCFFVPRDTDCWSDLENALTFDCESYIKQYVDAFDRDIDVNKEEECKSQINAAGKFLKQSPKDIAREFTNEWFWEWIAKQYYKNIERECEIHKNDVLFEIVDKSSVCVNFNYTHTIEDFLKIREEQILYIHNRLPDKRTGAIKVDDLVQEIMRSSRKQFQFGSVRNSLQEWEKMVDRVQLKSSGQLMKKETLKKDIRELYWAFSKNLSENYDKLRAFIEVHKDEITEVVVLGHNILGVDEPYYRDVIVPMLKDKKWEIYWHGNDRMAKEFSDKYKLLNVQLISW